ncbi:unnamed protein product [Cochlearia groenlandica]
MVSGDLCGDRRVKRSVVVRDVLRIDELWIVEHSSGMVVGIVSMISAWVEGVDSSGLVGELRGDTGKEFDDTRLDDFVGAIGVHIRLWRTVWCVDSDSRLPSSVVYADWRRFLKPASR